MEITKLKIQNSLATSDLVSKAKWYASNGPNNIKFYLWINYVNYEARLSKKLC